MTTGKALLILAAIVIFWQPIQNLAAAAEEATDGDGILLVADDPSNNPLGCSDERIAEATLAAGETVRFESNGCDTVGFKSAGIPVDVRYNGGHWIRWDGATFPRNSSFIQEVEFRALEDIYVLVKFPVL